MYMYCCSARARVCVCVRACARVRVCVCVIVYACVCVCVIECNETSFLTMKHHHLQDDDAICFVFVSCFVTKCFSIDI